MGLKGWVRWIAHPFVVLGAGGKPSMLLLLWIPRFFFFFLLQALQKWQLGFLFCLCAFQVRICPSCACMQLFFSPYSFFVFCCWRRGVSRGKHCSQGSQVPGPGPSLLTAMFHFTPAACRWLLPHIPREAGNLGWRRVWLLT